MTIGVHAVAAFRENPTGVEGYLQHLLCAWQKDLDATAHRFLLYTPTFPKEGRDPDFKRNVKADHFSLRPLRAPFLWTQARLSWEIFRRLPDVLFVPATALPRVLPKHTVVTIHGLEFRHIPNAYGPLHRRYLDWATADAVRRAGHIIAVSEATKQDLLTFLDADPDRISVIHHGPPVSFKAREEYAFSSRVGPYFLYIGRIETKKNVEGIIRAYTQLRSRKRDVPKRLVLVGSPGFGFPLIQEALRRSPYRDEIELRGYVREEEKWGLLFGASGFVFPSWAEGFGFPILEAQQAGIPVVTGDRTAMPEIAGEKGALFVPPGDIGMIADAMERIVIDQQLRKELVAAGARNVQRFSWEDTARRTLRVLLNE